MPKATTEKSDRNDDQQLVGSGPVLSTSVHAQSSTAEGHHQGQQQASPTTQDAPVAAPRRLRVSQLEENHRSETKRPDVDQIRGQWRQDSDSARDYDSTDELTDNDDVNDVVGEAAGSSLSSSSPPSLSSRPGEDNITPYPVRWIGSTPISDQLYGKQRTDAIFAVTSKLSSAVDNLGRVSLFLIYNYK